MKISKKNFGLLSSGKKVYLYTLKAGDLSLSLSAFGATLVSLVVPSRNQGKADVLLGYSCLEAYTHNAPYFGVTIGRFGNRIRGGRFSLQGAEYVLYQNDGIHTLHGGRRGFDKLLWKADAYEDRDGVFVRFELTSPDGDEGFPGTCKDVVSYGLTKTNEMIADYQAQVDAPCPVNLTNHAYFNLAGEGNGDILSHEAAIHADAYVQVDASLIPTGELVPVAGGPWDFRNRKPIKQDFDAVPGGYDHCFVLQGEAGKLRPCAEVYERSSGRSLRVFTTQRGGTVLYREPDRHGSRESRFSVHQTQRFLP
ncbi:aldose 1-epimerase [Hollandina sp. SP2]